MSAIEWLAALGSSARGLEDDTRLVAAAESEGPCGRPPIPLLARGAATEPERDGLASVSSGRGDLVSVIGNPAPLVSRFDADLHA